MRKTIISSVFSAIMAIAVAGFAGNVMACDGMGPNKHMGSITSVNAADKTFTIRDAQLQIPITFKANDEIINALSNETGNSVQVNYEDNDGTLTALGVVL